jgi:GNAT superfamily N-acetyltransferase
VITRHAIAADAAEASAVLRESIVELCKLDHQGQAFTLDRWLSNKTEAQFERWLADPERRTIVAVVASSVAGVGALVRSGYIRLCYVSPRFTNIGVGRALVTALEAEARAWRIPKVRLESSLTARHFYERCGYVPAGDPTPGFGVLLGYPYEKQL